MSNKNNASRAPNSRANAPNKTSNSYTHLLGPNRNEMRNIMANLFPYLIMILPYVLSGFFVLLTIFNLNLKGSADTQTFDGKTYRSSDLTPTLNYDDGILNASIAKEIMEGNNVPNLRAGVDYNNFYLKGDDLLSEDRSGIVGYQKEFGDKAQR